MTTVSPFEANLALLKALGLDPKRIHGRNGVRIILDREGPTVEVTYMLTNIDGKIYAVDNELATELKRFKLVPLDDDEDAA